MIDLDGVECLADVARVQARRRGAETALVFEGRTTSFLSLDERASRIASQLLRAGFAPQERIACLAKNCDVFFEILFGAVKARLVLTPINARLAAPEIAFVLNDSRARLLFVGADFVDVVERALGEVAERPHLIALDFDRPGYQRFEAWRDAGEAADAGVQGPLDDDVLQLYTSGTTGLPKGVQLTNQNYLALLALAGGVEGFKYGPGETVLNAMPQFHVAGANIGLIAIASGARTVILKDLVPADVLGVLERERVNHAFFVPAVIRALMQAPEMAATDLSAMKTLSYGASPIAEDLLRKAQARFGCGFIQFYGMTETTGAGAYLPPGAHEGDKLRSCGIPWPGIDVKVVDPDGRETRRGEVGEIVIRSAVVMKGYWNRAQATAEAVAEGWMKTGDAAYQDEEGYFYIHDRMKDMIVTGGENVYPAEVENALSAHPDIADVAVIGVPDERWGEAVKAMVILRPGAAADAAAIIAWMRERLAGFKAPKTIDFIDAIPRNPSGKILRRELRAPFWENRGRMVG
jgi:acyl-CoA synthetase (AMP-forming)/AMP-acid ligase II